MLQHALVRARNAVGPKQPAAAGEALPCARGMRAPDLGCERSLVRHITLRYKRELRSDASAGNIASRGHFNLNLLVMRR
jgi:hypothetical protein